MYLFHGANNIDVAVQDHCQGNDEAENKQVDDVGRRIGLVGIPINGAAEVHRDEGMGWIACVQKSTT